MDTLSEVLKAVTLKGAIFFNAEFFAPWSFRSPATKLLTPYLGQENAHVIVYHLVVDGDAWIQLEGGSRVEVKAGDIVIFPHGDTHLMGNGVPSEPVDHAKDLQRILSRGLAIERRGTDGPRTKFICGYMVCDPHLSRLVLGGLPPLLKVNIRDEATGQWLENSIMFSVAKSAEQEAGTEAVLAKLAETLFIETLRRYAAKLPPAQSGWLAGMRDSEVGKALLFLHQQPAHDWTIGSLATKVGVSRAVLAERFRHYLGEPPIAYLTRLRLQLGARLLRTTRESVAEIAMKVGYSEAAFNRAFRRTFGAPPARFRKSENSSKAASAHAG